MSNTIEWLPALLQWAPARTRGGAADARSITRDAQVRRRLVFAEATFRAVLDRECSRADRFSEPVGLLLVESAPGGTPAGADTWSAIVEALSAATRQTDIQGWVTDGTAFGVILTDIRDIDGATMTAIERRVQRELELRLLSNVLASVNVRVHVHEGLPATAQALEADRTYPEPSPFARSRRREAPSRDAVKRALDVVGSLLLLLALLPVFVVIGALVKLTSPGPVFFRQPRIGEGARPFTMLKFRSMRVGVDPALHHQFVTQFIKAGARAVGNQGVFKLTNDPRITPLGRILRRTSLDELPQFWNVLRGDMSLVGPRPPLAYELEQYRPWHWRRVLDAKPGVTGLWQVTGRSRTTFDEMVRLDLRYARTRGLWVDLKILLKTPAAVISGKGAC